MDHIIFDIPLPFRIPIKDEVSMVSSNSKFDFKSTFYTLKKDLKDISPYDSFHDRTMLVVTINVKDGSIFKLPENQILNLVFKRTLEYINTLIFSFKAAYGLSHIWEISTHDLPLGITTSMKEKTLLYTFSHQKILPQLAQDITDISKVMQMMSLVDKQPDIALVERFFESAKTYLHKEIFINAIIDLETSFEIFIRNTVRLIAIKNGTKGEKLERLSRIPFKNALDDHIGKYLKFERKTNKQFVDWEHNLYQLRNDIVHSGRTFITGNEAYVAYDAYVSARNFVADRLVRYDYLTPDGKVDLSLFTKNTRDTQNNLRAVEHLKAIGFLPDKEIEIV